MTTIDLRLELQNPESLKGEEVIQKLTKFREIYQETDQKTEKVWEAFRMLPHQAQYLVASHRYYERKNWNFMSRWELVQKFDKELSISGQSEKILKAIDTAIAVEKRIIALELFFEILTTPALDLAARAENQKIWEQINLELKIEILKKVQYVYEYAQSKSLDEYNDTAHAQNPDEEKVVNLMLELYKRGHVRLNNEYFKALVTN